MPDLMNHFIHTTSRPNIFLFLDVYNICSVYTIFTNLSRWINVKLIFMWKIKCESLEPLYTVSTSERNIK